LLRTDEQMRSKPHFVFPMNTAAAVTSSMAHLEGVTDGDAPGRFDWEQAPHHHEPVQVTILCTQGHGVTSGTFCDSGEPECARQQRRATLEAFLHRRLKFDDNRGLGEALDDTSRSVSSFWMLFDSVGDSNTQWRQLSARQHNPLRVFLPAEGVTMTREEWYVVRSDVVAHGFGVCVDVRWCSVCGADWLMLYALRARMKHYVEGVTPIEGAVPSDVHIMSLKVVLLSLLLRPPQP